MHTTVSRHWLALACILLNLNLQSALDAAERSADAENDSASASPSVTVNEKTTLGADEKAPAGQQPKPAKTADKQAQVVPLKSTTFKEVKQAVGPFLSKSGRLVYVSSRNAILIYDTPENIKRIRNILKEIDLPPINIRVSITFDEVTEERGAGVDVGTGGIVISKTHRGETEVSGDVFIGGGAHSQRRTDKSTQFLMTRNNRPARIWIGKTVAHQVWTFKYGIRHGWWESDIIYQDIGASLWIHPRLVGNNLISIEVYPKLTIEGPNPLCVKAKELSTEVMVQDGGTVQLGGLNRDKREAYKRLFGVGSVFNGHRLAITLQAKTVRSSRAPDNSQDR